MDKYEYAEENNGKVFAITRYSPTENNGGIVSSENLVGINSRSRILKSSSFYKRLSILLCLLFIIILVALIAVSCLYAKSNFSNQICNTPECLRSAANLIFSMDTSVDPCEDFYQYSCGHWSEEHPNHGWYPKFSNFETIEERISIATMKFLESNSSDKDPLPVKQCRDFYRSCMDVESADKQGYNGIYKYLKEANMPLIPHMLDVKNGGNEARYVFDWIKAEAVIKKVFYMDIFIGFTVDANMFDRSNFSMYVGTPAATCPLPSPFRSQKKMGKGIIVEASDNQTETDEGDEKYIEAHKKIYKEVIRALFTNLSVEIPEDSVLERTYYILGNFSKDFDKITENYTTSDEYIAQIYTVNEIQNATDQFLISKDEKTFPMWNKYLTYLYDGINNSLNFDGSDTLMVDSDELTYLTHIVYLLLKTPDAYLELYMWWVTVYAMIINTSSDIVEYISKQGETVHSYSQVIRSRSMVCASLTTNFMGMAVSYGVADKTFLNSTKPRVQQMLMEIKEAFVERVNHLKWMDKKTKEVTLEKSKHMTSFIGFPEWLFEPGALEEYYKGIKIYPDKYLDNMMEITKTYMPSKLALIGQENMQTWRTEPLTVNAYNYFSDNAINVPMAILSFPVYNLGLEVLNYAAIGSILGHELTHGFDNTGRKYDVYGSYNQWWSNNTVDAFEDLTKCFVKQYNNYTVPLVDGNIDGERTLGENMADNGGLNHAYLAYQHYLRRYGPEPHLPGFEDYSTSQLFFIAFGNIWCESAPTSAIKFQLDNDEHCPNYVRVVGTLQNSKEFAEAFKCPVGSKMNPNRTRCRIW